ncbi:unnamed protein product [Darwinula stevensoni]|uniref:Kringle domain-containing protein n=1 Tax=Darwinula stevensoni TaxID=69355 RepID=A0A7R9A170_9CRUS|nr:unnamed protein product [Darwinula stevensoni]CAG0882827.1 unnamed protein product [Darwinula stevensoni]
MVCLMTILILAAVYPECRLSEKGMEYVGKTNVTETGKACLRWDSEQVTSSYESLDAGFNEVLFYEEHFINQDPSLHENFCRNPTGLARPWCFVDDDGVKMEFCWIRLCDDFSENFHEFFWILGRWGVDLDNNQAGILDMYLAGGIMNYAYILRGSKAVPECKLSQKGGEYVGVKDKTISGFDCIPWLDADSSGGDRIRGDREGSFSDELTDSHNFCRNPNGNPGGPWCNIEVPQKPNLKWEYCDVSFCDLGASRRTGESGDQYESNGGVMQPNYETCRITEMGKEYYGEEKTTETGKDCEIWPNKIYDDFPISLFSHLPFQDRQFPGPTQKIRFFFGRWTELAEPNKQISEENNSCRNYGSMERPWCIVSLANLTWEYCDIPLCHGPKVFEWCLDCTEPAECMQTTNGREYLGLKNVTRSGKKCQPWLSQMPNVHSTILRLPMFPDPVVDSRHNYCRNPDLDKKGPWCYNGEGTNPEWEYCDIEFCEGMN